jgi:hypothetical protein
VCKVNRKENTHCDKSTVFVSAGVGACAYRTKDGWIQAKQDVRRWSEQGRCTGQEGKATRVGGADCGMS